MSKKVFGNAKIYPECDVVNRMNPEYISSDSDSESCDNICGIAINIGKKGKLETPFSPKKMEFKKFNDINEFKEFDDINEFNDSDVSDVSDCADVSDYNDFTDNNDNDTDFKGSKFCFRSYSITCEKDDWNIQLGRCPDYALEWGHDVNRKHWPIGHDYLNGHKGAPGRDEFKKLYLEILLEDMKTRPKEDK